MLVLVCVIVLVVGVTLLPILFGLIGILLLEKLNLDAWKDKIDLTSVSANHFLYSDTIIYFCENLNVLIHVDMCGPAVSNSEKCLLEHDQVHGRLTSGVMDPLLSYLAVHLFFTIEGQQNFVDAFHQLSVLLLRDNITNITGLVRVRLLAQQLPILG